MKLATLFVITALCLLAEVPTGQEIRFGNVSILLSRSGPSIFAKLNIPYVPGAVDNLQILVKSEDRATVAFRVSVRFINDAGNEQTAVCWTDADRADNGTPRYAMAALPMALEAKVLSVEVRELVKAGNVDFKTWGRQLWVPKAEFAALDWRDVKLAASSKRLFPRRPRFAFVAQLFPEMTEDFSK